MEFRCTQRNVSVDEVLYVIEHGRWAYRAGTKMYFLGKRDIPVEDRSNKRIQQLEGLCVHTKQVGKKILIITVYRNRNSGLKDHRRKSKFDRYKVVA